MSTDRLVSFFDTFAAPGAAYRGKPFWAWNGRLETDELRRQIGVLQQMGFGGFFMHARIGLETPNLGSEWFDAVRACVDEARKLGMEAWLYDEDQWPSGSASHQVTERPELRARAVVMTVYEHPAAFTWTPDVVAAFAANLAGRDATDLEVLSAGQTSLPPDGRSVVAMTVTTGGHPDRMNHDCLTHLFVDVFGRRIGEWCAAHGISCTGHLVEEATLMCQTRSVGGARLRVGQAEYRTVPVPQLKTIRGSTVLLAIESPESFGGLEIVCLLGDFGVRVSGVDTTDTALPRDLAPGDWCKQDSPFYGGAVSYRHRIRPRRDPDRRVVLQVGAYCGTCVRVCVDGKPVGIAARAPNEVDITDALDAASSAEVELSIELFGHRRNSHGPLHPAEPRPACTGPADFLSDGRDDYSLVPFWLMTPPHLATNLN